MLGEAEGKVDRTIPRNDECRSVVDYSSIEYASSIRIRIPVLGFTVRCLELRTVLFEFSSILSTFFFETREFIQAY